MGLLGLGLKLKKTLKAKKVAPDITKVKPTVGKELSESTRGLQLAGWAKRMRKKLKKD